MLVMKFGGTSVESAAAIERVAGIVKGRLARKPVVVVSAMGKTTNKLLAIAAAAVGWWTLPLVGAVAVAVLGTGLLARRKIGGISGDVLGATEQVAECLALVVLTGLLSRT